MISITSIGRKWGEQITADVYVPAFQWAPPPPGVRDRDGRDPTVRTLIVGANPVIQCALYCLVQSLVLLEKAGASARVVVACNDGVHRSVAGAEALAQMLEQKGIEPKLTHRDLGRRGL